VNLSPLLLSFQIALLATAISGLVGVSLAGAMATTRFRGSDLLEALTTAPMVMPPTVLGYYLLVAFGRHSVLGRAYEAVVGSAIVFSPTAAVLAATVGAVPFVVKSSRAAMEQVDPRLVWAARTLGASPFRAFLSIVLPLSTGGIGAGLALGFARALGDFGATLMVAGDIPGVTQTASLSIYDAVQAGREGDAAGMILVLTSIAMLTLYSVNKLVRRQSGA
jgi:molybdate transport system permease protein